MNKLSSLSLLICAVCCGASAQDAQPKSSGDTKRVYADFECVEGERIVSNDGGLVLIEGRQQNSAQPVKFSNSDKPHSHHLAGRSIRSRICTAFEARTFGRRQAEISAL